MDAAIPLPAGLVVLLANRLFFAIAEDVELSGGDTDLDKVVLGGPSAPITEGDVVLSGTTLVGVPFDGQLK